MWNPFKWLFGGRKPAKTELQKMMARIDRTFKDYEKHGERLQDEILELRAKILADPEARKRLEEEEAFEYGPLGSEC